MKDIEVEFDTAAYVKKYGKVPCGRDYWLFRFKADDKVVGEEMAENPDQMNKYFLPLQEAKVWARRRAKALEADTVEILRGR